MITVKDKAIEVTTEGVKEDLKEYLVTYADQYREMAATFEWMMTNGKLGKMQISEWEQTLAALRTICVALDAGFDPITPPKKWASGLLENYLAPIPQHIREAIDKAEPIFGRERILIFDPNPRHFQKPRVTDPLAIGHVDLVDQRLNFLIGQWDIAEDLKFIKGVDLNAPLRAAARGSFTPIIPMIPDWGSSDHTINIGHDVFSNVADWNTLNVNDIRLIRP